MGISISFGGLGGPLAALAGSIFGNKNAQFPPDGSGPSITFTALLSPGAQFAPNSPAAGTLFSFSQGSVRLYLPQTMSTQFSANYEETEISTLLKPFLTQGSAGASAIAGQVAQAAGAGAVGNVAGMVGGALGVTGAEAATDIALNRAKNNHMEVMFKGMGFREFTFEFKFFPRNAGESASLKGVIDSFKVNMHPDFKEGTGEAYFLPPTKYSIHVAGGSLYGGYTDAVLTNVTVNYSGAGVAAIHEDGNPAEIDLSLTFKETKYLTKRDFMGGKI